MDNNRIRGEFLAISVRIDQLALELESTEMIGAKQYVLELQTEARMIRLVSDLMDTETK